MVCIYCSAKTSVTNSRSSGKSKSTWRRRRCQACHAVFTTREQIDYEGALRVRNGAGSLEPFWRDKLFLSVYNSLSHRKAALGDATELTATIITKLVALSSKGLLETEAITNTAEEVLKRFDKVAAIHYKAHH